MYEVELKVAADVERVADRLTELGAEHVRSIAQSDTYYDAPHRDFAETDEAVRIRHERDADGTATRLTYKGPRVDETSKTREEFETTVAERDALEGILDGIGFEPAAVVEKTREQYALEGMTVTLDTVEGVGEYVEVETEVQAEDDVPAARDRAAALLADLGLDPDEQVRTSYLGLLLNDQQ